MKLTDNLYLGAIDIAHLKFKEKYFHYDTWHSNKAHQAVHWGVLFIYLGLTFGALIGYALNPSSIFAASNIYIETAVIEGQERELAKYTIQSNKDTAVANGVDAITVTAGAFTLVDNGLNPTPPEPYCNEFSGTIYKRKLKLLTPTNDVAISPATQYINCSTGLATFTLKSTHPGQKSVVLYYEGKPTWEETARITASFTAPSVTKTNNAATSTNIGQTATTPPSTDQNQAFPVGITAQKPILLEKINTSTLSSKEDENFFEDGQKLKLSGRTFPNSNVRLFIYSDPFTAQTKSDSNGYWEYEIEKSLEAGGHRVEAEVTKSDGTVLPKVEVAKFRIAAVSKEVSNTPATKPQKTNDNYIYWLAGAAIVFLLTGLVTILIKQKKKPALIN